MTPILRVDKLGTFIEYRRRAGSGKGLKMLDLTVCGGLVVGPDTVSHQDIAVREGKIVALARPGELPGDGAEVVDASGKVVVPGGVEPHTHLAQRIVMRTEGEMYTLGPEEDTLGMAFGGVTTHIDFCSIYPDIQPQDGIEQRMLRWKGQSYIDYAFHVSFMGATPIEFFDQVPELVQAGFPSFKVFTCNSLPLRPPRRPSKIDFGRIGLLMEKAALNDGIVVVHGEDDDLVQFNYELFTRDGRTAGTNLHLVHSKLSEQLSFERTIQLARATGAAIYFVHTSAGEGVAAITRARSAGQPVYGETLHQYLCHTAADYAAPQGFRFHTYPSIKTQVDQDALWEGILTCGLSTIATDEFPTSLDVKLMGSSIDDVTGGNLGAEARMGIAYTEGVTKRGMSLRRFVDVTSANAAKIFGIYPRKGALAVGSDADLALMDLSQSGRRLEKTDFHVGDYSPWEGWEVTAWPCTTILRGRVITRNGKLVGKVCDGEFLPRKIDPELLRRPMV